jgi:hypothetical protein
MIRSTLDLCDLGSMAAEDVTALICEAIEFCRFEVWEWLCRNREDVVQADDQNTWREDVFGADDLDQKLWGLTPLSAAVAAHDL